MQFKDRKPTLLNRFKITPEGGSAYYVTLERADEPTEEGTPLNAENLNKIVTAAESARVTAENHAADKNNPHGVTAAQLGLEAETWIFTLEDGQQVPKVVYVG